MRSRTWRNWVPSPVRESAWPLWAGSAMARPALPGGVPVGRRDDRGVQRGAAAVPGLLDEDQLAPGPCGRQLPRRAEQVDEVEGALEHNAGNGFQHAGSLQQHAVVEEVVVAPVMRDQPGERQPEPRVGVARIWPR